MSAQKIKIKVDTTYLQEASDPSNNKYYFLYTVSIDNIGREGAKLLSRHWVIEDSNGKVQDVKGEGVVGEFPILQPGESFEYTSGTPLKTTNGIMQGFYLMSQNNGEQIKIDIPTFSLDSPYNKKNLH